MNTSKEFRFLIAWGCLWAAVAIALACFDAYTAHAATLSCTDPAAQGAIVTEVYRNGSTRTMVGAVRTWDYANGAMRLAYQADGIAISGFE